MARLIYSRRAVADLERVIGFLAASDAQLARRTQRYIASAVRMLSEHPLVGRQVDDDLRELIVSRGKTGYVVMYAYASAIDVVFLLAIRHQREVGYIETPYADD